MSGSKRNFKNVFVLCTGRCGSLTFSKACEHISNYSVGHETRAGKIGPKRLDYPDYHIEVDNRLSWFLGRLAGNFDLKHTYYVWLYRDEEDVAKSFAKRYPGGIIRAYVRALHISPDLSELTVLELARDYIETVTENICNFLESVPESNWQTFHIDSPKLYWKDFWEIIGAEGDYEMGLKTLDTKYNKG